MTWKGAIGFLLVSVVLSCDDEAEISASIEGKWQGREIELRVKPLGLPLPIKDKAPFDKVIIFQEDATVIIIDDSPVSGSYTLNGDKLDIEIDYSVEDFNLTGTYTLEKLTEQSLVFYREKKDTIVDPDNAPAVKGDIRVSLHFQRLLF